MVGLALPLALRVVLTLTLTLTLILSRHAIQPGDEIVISYGGSGAHAVPMGDPSPQP